MVPTSYYVVLSAILFGLGVLAFIFKRNIISIFMSIELMLNAVNLAFVAFSQAMKKVDGQVFVLFVIVVAAAEAAVGLAIIILTARNRQSLNVERVDLLETVNAHTRTSVDHSTVAPAGSDGEWIVGPHVAKQNRQCRGHRLHGIVISGGAGSGARIF